MRLGRETRRAPEAAAGGDECPCADRQHEITGSFQAFLPGFWAEGRKVPTMPGTQKAEHQSKYSEKDTGKGPSLPYAQQCFKLCPTLFKVRKDAEGPVLVAVVWSTLS